MTKKKGNEDEDFGDDDNERCQLIGRDPNGYDDENMKKIILLETMASARPFSSEILFWQHPKQISNLDSWKHLEKSKSKKKRIQKSTVKCFQKIVFYIIDILLGC